MIELINERLYDKGLIRHYAKDSNGNKYYIKQIETGFLYDEAFDVFPCKYTYEVTNILIEDEVDDVR